MAATRNGRRELEQASQSNTNANRRVLIDIEDYDDYMPKYNGEHDPIAANMWLSSMETFFNAIDCADEDKVVYAVSMLRSEAKTWWDKIKDMSGPTEMTWCRFCEVFREEFSPLRMEMELVEKFATIKQGRNERVREYTSRFQELVWFYTCCLTPEKRLIYMFVKGLKANIKDFIPDKDLTSWDKMLAAALLIEKENNRRLEDMNALNMQRV
ncbi:zinc finger, CCHC-type, Retrotransposon gag domain protein [Artemisia annua]|uniref:Zinc finger, CCHC-type, Retrotransposon gag domain protein n=1 Tax=Artemisia annua TaxID=35608 RepID=A0A2U1KHW5_ARTAN|nr:zinc finger, CCHC-type, Retrotransposon gag domain protein [Artemisia annua]